MIQRETFPRGTVGPMDTLEQMRALIAVADEGSFTKAGHSLGRSKALISRAVGDLEDRLAVRLFNRTTRSVRLTEAGSAYVERARTLLAEFDDLEDAIRATSLTARGRLRLTAPQAFGELALAQLLCRFQAAHPEIQVDAFLSDRVVDLVAEGFDVAMRVTQMHDSSLIARHLCDMPVHVVASPIYLERKGTPQHPSDLAEHDCLIDTNLSNSGTWRLKDPGSDTILSVRVASAWQVNSVVAVRQAALVGHGIALSPTFAVANDIADGELKELFPGAADYELALHLVYPHRSHLSPKVRAFIDFCAAWYKASRPWASLTPAPGGRSAAAGH